MLDKIWDDVMAGPQPQRGLGKLRKLYVTTPGKYAAAISAINCIRQVRTCMI